MLGNLGLIPGLGRPCGEGHGNPLQYSCLENPHGQRSLAGIVCGVEESDWVINTHVVYSVPFLPKSLFIPGFCPGHRIIVSHHVSSEPSWLWQLTILVNWSKVTANYQWLFSWYKLGKVRWKDQKSTKIFASHFRILFRKGIFVWWKPPQYCKIIIFQLKF